MLYEDGVMKAIAEVGVDVDKEELIRALKYDRQQYQKGYDKGYEDGYNQCKLSVLIALKTQYGDGGDNE